jgi:hypothetical protein
MDSLYQKMQMSLLVVALVVSLVGCAPSGSVSGAARPENSNLPAQHSKRIVILDKNVADTLYYINSVQERLPRGELVIKAQFQNRFPDDDVWVDVKMEFMDQYNMVVDQTEWMRTLFPALEVTMVRGNSISTQAIKHVILMRNVHTASGKMPSSRGKIYAIE